MAKRQQTRSIAQQGNNHIVHQSVEEDDNLLPNPDELRKYCELDPEFMNWIKSRCDIEQKGRLDHRNKSAKFAESTNRKLFTIDILSLLLSTGVICSLMYGSYSLIIKNHEKIGFTFGSISIITFAVRILNFRKKKTEESDVN
jgi:uncharacterized membrane protein